MQSYAPALQGHLGHKAVHLAFKELPWQNLHFSAEVHFRSAWVQAKQQRTIHCWDSMSNAPRMEHRRAASTKAPLTQLILLMQQESQSQQAITDLHS